MSRSLEEIATESRAHVTKRNEQELHQKWKQSETENKQLLEELQKLQQQFSILQTKYHEMEEKLKSQQHVEEMEYHTEEEELAKETEWIRQKEKRKVNKKRKMDKSLTPPQLQQVQEEPPKAPKKAPLPPPIVVEDINDYNELYEELNGKLPGDFQIKLMNSGNMKINVRNEDGYRLVTKQLNEKKYPWHSYENKQNRPIKVIAKNLHHSCNPQKIVEALKQKGYKALNASNQLKWRTKEPLNMFMLTFQPEENINKVFEIDDILGAKVQIVPLKSSRLVPQCKRCQAYDHTQHYCAKEPRCVKCAGKHLTNECRIPADTKPKCVHCGEAHPANYRGCMVAREMQKLKNKRLKKQTSPTEHQTPNVVSRPENNVAQTQPSTSSSKTQSNNRTYAQTVRGPTPDTRNKQDHGIGQTLELILAKLDSFDERLTRLELGAATRVIPKQRNGQRP